MPATRWRSWGPVTAGIILAALAVIGICTYLALIRPLLPVSLPAASERTSIKRLAVDYLDAWRRNDARSMAALMSPASLTRRGPFPQSAGGDVAVTGQLWRPSRQIACVLVVVSAGRNSQGRWDEIALPLYTCKGRKYSLVVVREAGRWKVLSGPGCELPSPAGQPQRRSR